MNLRDLASSLWRRKLLLLPLLALVAGACFVLASVISPAYESKASVLLLPPKGGAAEVVNPYLSLNGLSPAVEVLAGSLSDQETADVVQDLAPGTTYEAFADPQGSAPVLFITVDADDAEQSTQVLETLVQRAQAELEDVQAAASIDAASLIGSVVVSQDAEPEVIQKQRIRVVAAAGVVLLVGGLALIGLIDGLLLRRGARQGSGPRPGTAVELAGSGPPPGPGPEAVNGKPAPLALTTAKKGTPAKKAAPAKNPALKSGRKPRGR